MWAKFAYTASDGKDYNDDFYNLDVIISVGYRVKSQRGTQFRIWASISEESMEAMKNALSIYNLGISPEVRGNLTQVSVAVSNAMKTVNQLDFSGLYEAVSRFAEVRWCSLPVKMQEN